VAAIMLVIGGSDALTGLQNITIVASVPFVFVMVALCVSLWKDLQSDPVVVRHRLGQEAVEGAVVVGVEEHDGDFALVVEPTDSSAEPASDEKQQ
jgi:choline-glycine betaine transporter